MLMTSFTDRKSGDLVAIPPGVHAFVPTTLPISDASTMLTPNVVAAFSDATLEIGRLDGQSEDFAHAEVLIAPFVRREAVLSSRIEGTQTTYTDLVFYEAAAEIQKEMADTREVSNYVDALRYGLKRVEEVSVGKQLICEVHQMLMARTPEEYRSGKFRAEQVHISPRGVPISEARFVPPPALQVEPLMDNLVRYMQADDTLPLLVRLAIIHYQFEAIHPFYDGNGRIGRLVMPLLLCHARVLRKPMLYISAYFERRRTEYTDCLFNVSADGRWSEWIAFFLRAIAAQARDSRLRMRQLQALRTTYWSRISKARNAPALLKLVDALIESPVMTKGRAQSVLHQSLQSSSTAVDKLVLEKILEPLNVKGRTGFFFSRQILAIVERAEGPEEDGSFE